jgi:hypothetical protein
VHQLAQRTDHPHRRYEVQLAAARARRRDPDRAADYRATRPKVERKLGHLMRRRHEADESGCAANDESAPTSTSSSPPPTWRAWPFSACALRQRADGRQPDEDDGAVPTRCFHPPWRRSHRHRLPSPATPRPPPPRRNPKQGAADATRHQPRGPHSPSIHTSHLGLPGAARRAGSGTSCSPCVDDRVFHGDDEGEFGNDEGAQDEVCRRSLCIPSRREAREVVPPRIRHSPPEPR